MTSLNSSLRLAVINKAKSKKNGPSKGFTLVELLVVVGIIGVLSSVALPNFLSQRDKALIGRANSEVAGIMTACEAALANGDAPNADDTVTDAIAALTTEAKAQGAVTPTATGCTGTVTGTEVTTDGAYTAFGTKTPAK